MKRLLWITASLCLCVAAFAETWTLTDEKTGEVFGPVSPAEGVTIEVGNRTLVLQVSQTKKDQTEARLKRIIIPALEFRNANVGDVVQFLMEASLAADPENRGVNIVLSSLENAPSAATSPQMDEWGFGGEGWGDMPSMGDSAPHESITLSLRRVSQYDAISIIAEVAHLDWRIDESGIVMIKKKDLPKGEVP